jgi:hypothetical protein
MVRKLNKSEHLVDEQMLAPLEWAADHPKNGTESAVFRTYLRRAIELPQESAPSSLHGERGRSDNGDARQQARSDEHGGRAHGCDGGRISPMPVLIPYSDRVATAMFVPQRLWIAAPSSILVPQRGRMPCASAIKVWELGGVAMSVTEWIRILVIW